MATLQIQPTDNVPSNTNHEATTNVSVIPSTSNTKLPDMDAFSSFGEVQPGMLPLLVQMPDGMREQIDVPITSTVDDIKATLQRHTSNDSNILTDNQTNNSMLGDDFRLSFGNSDLDPSSNLMDTTIVNTYENAGSLLEVIASSTTDVETKSAALDSACAVVERISNGIKDMEALCEAAVNNTNNPNANNSTNRKDTNTNENTTVQQQQINKDDLVDGNQQQTEPPAPSASALAHSLSRHLPDLFPPDAAAKTHPKQKLPSKPETIVPEPQPTISSIRDLRRKARAERSEVSTMETPPQQSDENIGYSTYDQPLPNDLNSNPKPAVDNTNIMLAQSSGKSTWLEDVMKTWQVKTVRESGVLEKSKDGQDVNQYFDNLEAEARKECNNENDPSGEIANATNTGNTNAGESDDEEDDLDNDNSASSTTTTDTASDVAKNVNGSIHKQADVNMTPNEISQQPLLQRRQPQQLQQNTSVPPATTALQQNILPANASTPQPLNMFFPNSASPRTPSSGTSSLSSGTTVQSAPVRRLTKIAPAPTLPTTPVGAIPPIPGAPNVNGGPFAGAPVAAMFQGVPPPPGTWSKSIVPPGQKKRGRKRKNPQLTDEERALVRKEQNRESARLSRVRRKVIAAEYEGKINELVNENSSLRKQVEGLNNRLVYLQSILTVTVRPGDGRASDTNGVVPNENSTGQTA